MPVTPESLGKLAAYLLPPTPEIQSRRAARPPAHSHSRTVPASAGAAALRERRRGNALPPYRYGRRIAPTDEHGGSSHGQGRERGRKDEGVV